ncbi:MAG: hypothetical protein KDA74_07345 [Planctomycetaceae bacterium]|nr:hypothetical protein [Planctomycetaceae bacterium]
MTSGKRHSIPARLIFLVLLAVSLTGHFRQTLQAAEPGRTLLVKFPRPFHLEQIWTFREFESVSPPCPGIVFWTGTDYEAGTRRLAITGESLLSEAGLQKLLTTGVKEKDPGFYYQGEAPARDLEFQKLDLDGDGKQEVLLTGRGGAGGTSLLQVFKISEKKVTRLFTDSSRFGFWIFDETGDGSYEIANPGFAWTAGPDDQMQPSEFKVYTFKEGTYQLQRSISAASLDQLLQQKKRNARTPFSRLQSVSIINYYQ